MQPKKMLGEEGEVYPYKHDKELDLCPTLGQRSTSEGRESKCDPSEDGKHGAYGEDIMEVRDHIIGVM